VGIGLRATGDLEKAMEIFEYGYLIAPHLSSTLQTLAETATAMNRIRAATEYYQLLRFMRPMDQKAVLHAAKNMFFHLGRFEEAEGLAKDNPLLLHEDPELTLIIRMGSLFLRGDLEGAVNQVTDFGYKEKIWKPEIMYYSACFYYLLEEYEQSRFILDALNRDFKRNAFQDKARVLHDKVNTLIESQMTEEERRQKEKEKKAIERALRQRALIEEAMRKKALEEGAGEPSSEENEIEPVKSGKREGDAPGAQAPETESLKPKGTKNQPPGQAKKKPAKEPAGSDPEETPDPERTDPAPPDSPTEDPPEHHRHAA
jgi:tetratricopeptide (TPR) repeat protein